MTKWIAKARTFTLFSTLSSVVFSCGAVTIITNADGSAKVSHKTPAEIASAELFQQCFPNVPAVKPPLPDTPAADKITLLSSGATVTQGDKAVFQGHVNFTQGNRELSADEVTLYQLTNILTATGNVELADAASTIRGAALSADLDSKDVELSQVSYQLNGQAANGSANKIMITDSGNNIAMQRSTYTECPLGDNSWELRASEINVDNVDESAEAYNATLYFKDVPIFYMPYFTYPISDKRRSGLLFPSFGSSLENGITYSQPVYWNIAPNYDMVITPTYMSERGLELATEFRYLVAGQEGNINVEYLANDKKTGTDRSLYHWQHNGNFNEHLSLSANYTQVSDDDYFEDLDAAVGSRDSNTLLQTAQLNYNTDNTESELEVRNFQVLNDYTDVSPHKVLPKLSFYGISELAATPIQVSVYSEISNFSHSDSDMYSAIRTHIEPGITLPYIRPQGFAVAEFKLPITYYQQDFNPIYNGDFANGYSGDLDEQVYRVLPTARLHAGLNFERPSSWFGKAFRQTLEPQVQYLYVPYRDQNDIGIYDSANMQLDFAGLYRDRVYSGLDRFADSNQVTLGLTNRFYDAAGSEKFRLSLGQIVSFSDRRTSIKATTPNTATPVPSSFVIETDFSINNRWLFNNSVEYSVDDKELSRTDAAIEYAFAQGQRIQVNYRYIKDVDTIIDNDNPDNNPLNTEINQVGSKFMLPINNQWDMGASYYYDMENQITQDAFIGIKYEDCCWAIRLDYGYRLKDHNINTGVTTFDQGPTLMFELKGLGGIGNDMNNIGTSSLFEYGQPFQLRQ